MKGFMKILLAFGVLLYVVLPVDLMPGPIDDAIMILVTLAANKPIRRAIAE